MILRTPQPNKKRKPEEDSPNSDGGHFVIFEDLPVPEPSHQHSDQMLCTYQCRQLVISTFRKPILCLRYFLFYNHDLGQLSVCLCSLSIVSYLKVKQFLVFFVCQFHVVVAFGPVLLFPFF